jgi:hypothetical protein
MVVGFLVSGAVLFEGGFIDFIAGGDVTFARSCLGGTLILGNTEPMALEVCGKALEIILRASSRVVLSSSR